MKIIALTRVAALDKPQHFTPRGDPANKTKRL